MNLNMKKSTICQQLMIYQQSHEGTDTIKQKKIILLVGQYESCKMKKNESIDHMFAKIPNHHQWVRGLGRTYKNVNLNHKILRCFPNRWRHIITTTRQAKDLNLEMDQILGALKVQEIELEEDDSKKPKSVALKFRNQEQCV